MGARSSEVTRLELEDCQEDDGIPTLLFTWKGKDKNLKADASELTTSLHPDLIKLAFGRVWRG